MSQILYLTSCSSAVSKICSLPLSMHALLIVQCPLHVVTIRVYGPFARLLDMPAWPAVTCRGSTEELSGLCHWPLPAVRSLYTAAPAVQRSEFLLMQ